MIIAVDGPMAAGKTTLATVLGRQYGMPVFLEDSTHVPVPREFNRDPERYALETELALLRLHAAQLEEANAVAALSVTDLSLQRDLAYARITLGGYPNASATFTREWRKLRQTAPIADLVVLLECPASELLRRTRILRGAEESASYLALLISGLKAAHREFPAGKVVLLDASGPVEEYAIPKEIAGIMDRNRRP